MVWLLGQKRLIMWSLYLHRPPSGCAITSRMLMQASRLWLMSLASLFYFVGVFIESSSYYMQVSSYISKRNPSPPSPAPFFLVVSCSGACVRGGGINLLLQRFWLFKICLQRISVPFFLFVCFLLYHLRCCLSFLTANPNFFFLKWHGPGWNI